jgi:hypothetical protein
MIRKHCIFCDNELTTTYFNTDYVNYVGHYQVELSEDIKNHICIPFNICVCSKCKTAQTKYLGDLNEIYKYNHADSTGSIMLNLHKLNCELILKYKDNINNIIEIGSSKGVLADNIIEKIQTDYYIIEPSFFGNRDNKIIIDDFYENVDDNKINANTIIISHVFEHFYQPQIVLNKIYNNKNITNFFLAWPDLEYYINNNVYHVLNTEHIYYIDNNFLIQLFKSYGFNLIEKIHYENHSVLFYFNRETIIPKQEINFVNNNYSLDMYYNNIFKNIENCNNAINKFSNCKKYIWPASVHSLYLFIFGLDEKLLNGMLDNSPNKIGKKIYGTNLEILSFNNVISNNDENTFIIINGGVFNNEIMKLLENTNINYLLIN